jgi:uridine kinase
MAELHSQIAEELARRGHAALTIAVDGVSGSGKTSFADDLAGELRARGRSVVRASVDDFHRPKAERYRMGRNSSDGHYLESYDYDALKRELLDPLAPGGTRVYRTKVFDLETDTPELSQLREAQDGTILIVDGLFLNRDELRDYWDLSIFLDVPFDVATRRCAARDGSVADYLHSSNRRYVEGETRYLKECRPRDRASIVIDNSDYSRPVWIR